jgi:hypothetical protein
MDSTFTHLAVMRGALACGSRPRQVIQDHITGEPCSPVDVSPPGRPRQPPYPSHLCALAVRAEAELVDRSRSPWDAEERRPSHAEKRKALQREILRAEIQAALGERAESAGFHDLATRLLNWAALPWFFCGEYNLIERLRLWHARLR